MSYALAKTKNEILSMGNLLSEAVQTRKREIDQCYACRVRMIPDGEQLRIELPYPITSISLDTSSSDTCTLCVRLSI